MLNLSADYADERRLNDPSAKICGNLRNLRNLRMDFGFFLIRLKKASFGELVHRLREALFIRRLAKNPEAFVNRLYPVPAARLEELYLPRWIETGGGPDAAAILAGWVASLGVDKERIEAFEERFRYLPFPKVSPAKGDPDIRAVWETGRLQHLTRLLHEIRENPKSEHVEEIRDFVRQKLLAWIALSPMPYGPHYVSAMECGLRIPVFIAALKILDNFTDGERRSISETIYQHAWLTAKRLSLYSSLGNHTVAECVGLLFAGGLFGKDSLARQWLLTGIRILERESRHQILDDGGPAEQSLSYHRFVLDLYWLAVDFLETNRFHDCTHLRERLQKGEQFLGELAVSSGKLPAIGDSDDGHAVAPGLGTVIKGFAGFSVHDSEFCVRTFDPSGYSVVRLPNQVQVIFDHGSLGMAPLYNHGHADALSVLLYKHGLPFLIDPGTYRYNGAGEFRAYFKGTRAHNTITVDGQDQAYQVTGFIWDKPYGVHGFEKDESHGRIVILAAHAGYERLPKPVTHTRRIEFYDSGFCTLRDTFSGRGVHDFEINFHLHPDVRIKQVESLQDNPGGWFVLENRQVRIFLKLLEGTFEVIRGQQDPLLGWYSDAYGHIRETAVLHCRRCGRPDEIRFETIVCYDDK